MNSSRPEERESSSGAARATSRRRHASEAALLLGVKRSEEPYGREDLDLLGAIADSLAMLIERDTVALGGVGECFDECPTCGACYASGTATCGHEGSRLVAGRVPRVLAGRYRIERRLGRGGMGTVYAAIDTGLDRQVALKVVRNDLVGHEASAARFQAEARSAASFAHPNVVTIHDFGVTPEGIGYLVMERLEGVTLRHLLQQQARLSPAQACAVLRDASAAVDAAHRRQLIHRDLKPENIFLTRSAFAQGFGGAGMDATESAKVLDFGLAKYMSTGETGAVSMLQPTHSGMLLGTPAYMAPEQLRGGEPGPHWDLWALTIVTYEMIAGRHPFAGAPIGGVSSGADGYPGLICAPLADASPSCRAFFVRALAIDAALRPKSALELFAEFQHTTAGQ